MKTRMALASVLISLVAACASPPPAERVTPVPEQSTTVAVVVAAPSPSPSPKPKPHKKSNPTPTPLTSAYPGGFCSDAGAVGKHKARLYWCHGGHWRRKP